MSPLAKLRTETGQIGPVDAGQARFQDDWKHHGAPVRTFERRMYADGLLQMPDGEMIRHWGFEDPANPAVRQSMFSPVVRVNQGERLNIKLDLQASAMKSAALSAAGATSASKSVSVNRYESCLYSWHAQKPGVWFYQSHTGTPHDFEMGLYGLLLIDPPRSTSGKPQLFDGGPVYDQEHVLVLDDVDPTWHVSAEQRCPDAGQKRRAFNPKYFLVNGVPNTEAAHSPLTTASVGRGTKLLLRLCNASFSLLRVCLGNLQASIVAVDGSPLGTRERPWTSCIPVRPGQPVFMATASRLDILIDFDPAMNDCTSGTSHAVNFEFLDLATRNVRNVNADHPAHAGRASTMLNVI